MTEAPQILLTHHLKTLKLPTVPHAAWRDSRLENGDAQTSKATAASIFVALLRAPFAEFHGKQLQSDDLSKNIA